MTAPALAAKDLRRVVIAAAVGNVIEWYDFYIFGSLAALLSVKFFAAGASGSAPIQTAGTITARVPAPPSLKKSFPEICSATALTPVTVQPRYSPSCLK